MKFRINITVNEFHADWIESKLSGDIQDQIQDLARQSLEKVFGLLLEDIKITREISQEIE